MQEPDRKDRDDFPLDDPEAVSLDGALDDPNRYDEVEDSPVGFVQVDLDKQDPQDDRPGDDKGERDSDLFTVGTDSDLVMDELAKHTDDEEVLDDFAERQELGHPDDLLDSLRNHHANSPTVSGEDVDADWARAEQVGEEAVGGSVATPDQDVVEELGEALGIRYDDNEPLDTFDKLQHRDAQRWELNSASVDPQQEDDDSSIDTPPAEDAPGDLSLDELEAEEDQADDEDDDSDIEDLLEEDDEQEDDEGWTDDDEDDWDDEDDDWDDEEIDDDFLLGGIDIDDED